PQAAAEPAAPGLASVAAVPAAVAGSGSRLGRQQESRLTFDGACRAAGLPPGTTWSIKDMSKFWIVVIVVGLLLLTVGGVAGHQMTKGDAFCSSCHAYERASWDHGMHPEVGCLECHTGGFMRDKTQ